MKRNLSVSLDSEVADAIEKAAAADGLTWSNMVNRILEQWLKANPQAVKEDAEAL